MSTIYVVEPGAEGGPGAMGAKLMMHALRTAGHQVTSIAMDARAATQPSMFGVADGEPMRDGRDLPRPDAWFVSLLYPRQWLGLADLFRRMGLDIWSERRADTDPLVVFGGQAMISPEAVAPFADVMALGDGEATAPQLAAWAARGRRWAMDAAYELGGVGYYVPSRHAPPDRWSRLEGDWSPVAIRGGRGHHTTVEVARGCRSKCAFCPIGWAGGTYREADPASVSALVAQSAGRPVNLFAPDFSSVTASIEYSAELERHGCAPRGRDARLDAAAADLRAGVPPRSYSFGIEGVSERLRAALGKPLPRRMILETMALLSDIPGGVKWYLIPGLPGETDEDREEFMALLDDLRAVYRGKLDITATLFQPVPHTPLALDDGRFNATAHAWCMDLRGALRARHVEGAPIWLASQPKGADRHELDVALQRADRRAAPWLAGLRGAGATVPASWRTAVLGPIGPIDVDGSWSHIDITDRSRLVAARERYDRILARGTA